MGSITEWLRSLSGPVVYAVVAMLVFAEDALFVGFVLPGETAAVLGGVIASTGGGVSIWLMVPVVVFSAIAGDSVGYEVGRHFGPKIFQSRIALKHEVRIEKARGFMRRRGPAAVFLGRFVALFRALVPTMAGASLLPYRTFLLFNALGGLVWGVGFTMLGYAAGNAYARVEKVAGRVGAVVVAVIVILALIVWSVRRHRAGDQPEKASEDSRAGGARNGSGRTKAAVAADPHPPEREATATRPERPSDPPDSDRPSYNGSTAADPTRLAEPGGPNEPGGSNSPGGSAGRNGSNASAGGNGAAGASNSAEGGAPAERRRGDDGG
jgi:membrane protein DedA with SNARE-associated domain